MRTLLVIASLLGVGSTAAAQDAIVKIYAKRSNGVSQGTGFFASADGQVITAYHVVEGARDIEVFHDRLGPFKTVRVDAISPQHDLAVLQLMNVTVRTPMLALDFSPDLSAEIRLSGYARGGGLAEVRGRATRAAFVDSQTISDRSGRALFRSSIDVVQLDLTIYGGMSGGPVLGSRGAVGILSGSYDEGGGFGWAIPVKYLKAGVTAVRRMPAEMTWPRSTLMTAAWRSLPAAVRVDARASELFDAFLEAGEAVAVQLDQMQRQALMTQANLRVHRPFLERVAGDPALGKDWDAAGRYLEPTGAEAFRSVREFGAVAQEYGEAARLFAVQAAIVLTWLTGESGLDNRRGTQVGAEARRIRQDVADLQGGIDAYLKVDGPALAGSFAVLSQGLSKTAGRAGEQARVQLAFLTVWQREIDKYASPQALVFNARVTSVIRRVARLIEPIMYEVE